jgi:hypothetical protein
MSVQIKVLTAVVALIAWLAVDMAAQDRRIWVMKEPGSMVEYDASTFALKQTSPIPVEVLKAPSALQVNAKGQMLFAPNSDDASPDVGNAGEKIWFSDGKATTELKRGFLRTASRTGSNQKIVESSPVVMLSADGGHLYWYTIQFSRLERDNVELAVTIAFSAWRTDISGQQREEIASVDLPECRCPSGSCSETCPELRVWAPEAGAGKYLLVTQFVSGQTESKYVSTSRYELQDGHWRSTELAEPLQRVLDGSEDGSVIVSAIPDTGCCGWENQSNDQTVLLNAGKKSVIFDEREQFKNPDYDVSFYTENAKIAPNLDTVAMTIESTAKPGGTIQLSEQGQASPAESQRIRKALADLPAVQVMSVQEGGKRVAFLPHAYLAGWLNETEILIIENQTLVAYNVATGARRRTGIKVTDPAFVVVR